MPTNARTLRVVLLTILTSLLPAATALAQEPTETPGADSTGLIVLSVLFCVFVVGLLAHTARRMSRLD